MAFFEETTTATEAQTPKYVCKVTKARTTKNDDIIMFDINVNGVDLKSLILKKVTVKKDGKKYKAGDSAYIINYASTKGNDGKYYNNYFFPISSDLQDNIIGQIKSLLG